MDINIYQIFYNSETREKILPGFIPLDNMENPRPDWFEFYVILDFLNNNKLKNDAWYGFLSPKFMEKTGYDSNFCINTIKKYGNTADVALYSVAWDQLAYFLNPFEQGDMWHPGLLDMSQDFFRTVNPQINLKNLVTDATTSVFSNYIVAKKIFWDRWLELAKIYFDYAEKTHKNITVASGSINNIYPMKTFIQERLASFILSTQKFNVISIDRSFDGPICGLFDGDIKTRKLLQACDLMKAKYREKNDLKYLDMYWSIRGEISRNNPY
jgi:hypothetical protein